MYVMGEKVGHSVLPIKRPGSNPSAIPRVLGEWKEGTVKPVNVPIASTGAAKTHEVKMIYCSTLYPCVY